MASYTEIDELLAIDEPTGLRRRVAIGTLVSANAIRLETEDPTDAAVQARKRFAQQVFKTVFNSALHLSQQNDTSLAFNGVFEGVYRSVLISNITATKDQITSALDPAIQTAVNAAVDLLAANFPDPVTP